MIYSKFYFIVLQIYWKNKYFNYILWNSNTNTENILITYLVVFYFLTPQMGERCRQYESMFLISSFSFTQWEHSQLAESSKMAKFLVCSSISKQECTSTILEWKQCSLDKNSLEKNSILLLVLQLAIFLEIPLKLDNVFSYFKQLLFI